MVPNSLGPAELLLHYGTEEQRRFYLPRLASGEEIPCFALTEPEAGSDAAGLKSAGIVCRGDYQGRQVLGMRLRWDKRYTTLGPVATVIGLAFRLFDPDHLIGKEEDLGITCALIPADLPGIEIGERHDPLGVPFLNGPTRGRDVFVPLESIVGGLARAGQGWRMLMQSLAAGRSISLPSLSVGGAELAVRAAGAYAGVREQFGLSLGKFEGVQEPLARMGAMTYMMNAARTVTASAVDLGEKPSVISAVVKRALTEEMRSVVNDAMDIMAGAGVSRGPNNILAGAYTALPIGITVEGANILTRSLIIFGQGAMRCHPHARHELEAVAQGELKAFDKAFFGHVCFVLGNGARALGLGLTGGRLWRPPVDGLAGRMIRQFHRMSAAFALTADVAMGTLGGDLKRREKISGRLADALTWLYLGSATIKRFIDDGSPERDAPFVRWSCEHALFRIQTALTGFLDNLSLRRGSRFPSGRPSRCATRKEEDPAPWPVQASFSRWVCATRSRRARPAACCTAPRLTTLPAWAAPPPTSSSRRPWPASG
jgi:acyl-CoA dehydrogenase